MQNDELREKLLEQFSDYNLSDEEVNIVVENNCECSSCGRNILEMDDFPYTREEDYKVLCEECYDEKYRLLCQCCEEIYEPREQDELYFALTPRHITEFGLDIKPGIYKILKTPFTMNDLVFGFDGFIDDTIELIRECNLDSMLTNINDRYQELEYADICKDCAEKYGLIQPLAKASIRYSNLFARIHHDINTKAIIARGY